MLSKYLALIAVSTVVVSAKTDYVYYTDYGCTGSAPTTKDGEPVGTCRGIPGGTKSVGIFTNYENQCFNFYTAKGTDSSCDFANYENSFNGASQGGGKPFCINLGSETHYMLRKPCDSPPTSPHTTAVKCPGCN